MGGPMMGFTTPDADVPIVKTTNCILAPTESELPTPPPAQACIRCGLCAEACPASLLPQQLFWFSQGKEFEKLEAHNLFDCIECGACSWVCPSNIPLVQYYRNSKAEIIQTRQEHESSEQSRGRFEAREQRLIKQVAEREEKRAARKKAAEERAKQAAAGDGEDPIQAAIERAKAKKAAQENA
jgi:electron transport complex protein RnfC